MSDPEIRRSPKIPALIVTVAGLIAIAGLIAMPYVAAADPEAGLSQWGRFFGRMHPVFLHLPIGMLSLVILLEITRLFQKEKSRLSLMPIGLTALTAVVASVFGFLLYQSNVDDYNKELVESHLWWGIGFAAACVLATMAKAWVNVAAGKGSLGYLGLLFATGGVMTVASHDGGSLTHGKTFLTDEMPNELRALYNKLPVGEKLPIESEEAEGEKTEKAPAIPPEEKVVYTAFIQPIFDQKCVSCHGPDKQKGSLRMDTYDLTLEGGKEGEGFEPGSAEDSNIVYRIELDVDDDEHMPPEGKKDIEDHELVVLKWWLDSGASPTAKLGELEAPAEVQEAISKLVPAEELEKQKAAAEQAANQEAEARAQVAAAVEGLQAEFPAALNFESMESKNLSFTAVSLRKNFTDEHLAKLQPIMPNVVTLDLASTSVTDAGLAETLAGAKSLKMLRVSETPVTDASMDLFASLPELESLNLYGTAVSTEGALKLKTLPNLKRLYLWQTQVDDGGAALLREEMPHCDIVLGIEVAN